MTSITFHDKENYPDLDIDPLIGCLESRYENSRENSYVNQAIAQIESQRLETDWMQVISTVQQLVKNTGDDDELMQLQPGYPVRYNAEQNRLFHVMPFSEAWADSVMNVAKASCHKSVIYVRGDKVIKPEIIQSIWDEICRASHVLVDLTNFNSNVAIELGIAHCMGKSILVVGQTGTEKSLFSEISKLRIHPYSTDELGKLQTAIGAFVSN